MLQDKHGIFFPLKRVYFVHFWKTWATTYLYETANPRTLYDPRFSLPTAEKLVHNYFMCPNRVSFACTVAVPFVDRYVCIHTRDLISHIARKLLEIEVRKGQEINCLVWSQKRSLVNLSSNAAGHSETRFLSAWTYFFIRFFRFSWHFDRIRPRIRRTRWQNQMTNMGGEGGSRKVEFRQWNTCRYAQNRIDFACMRLPMVSPFCTVAKDNTQTDSPLTQFKHVTYTYMCHCFIDRRFVLWIMNERCAPPVPEEQFQSS